MTCGESETHLQCVGWIWIVDRLTSQAVAVEPSRHARLMEQEYAEEHLSKVVHYEDVPELEWFSVFHEFWSKILDGAEIEKSNWLFRHWYWRWISSLGCWRLTLTRKTYVRHIPIVGKGDDMRNQSFTLGSEYLYMRSSQPWDIIDRYSMISGIFREKNWLINQSKVSVSVIKSLFTMFTYLLTHFSHIREIA